MATFSSNYSFLLSLIGSAGSLAAVLAVGNRTGGNDIQIDNGDAIVTEPNASGSGYDLNITGGDSTASFPAAGGDLVLSGGSGALGGADGVVRIASDLELAQDLTFIGGGGLLTGTGSPEGAVTATVGTLYERTDGSFGNTHYAKQSGAGNTGWVPLGPPITDEFNYIIGPASFTLSRPAFNDASNGIKLEVYLNGIKLREGVTKDYVLSNVSGPAGSFDTVTINATLVNGDDIEVVHLPF